ncbi:MAG: hypothetical protein H6993_19005 [Pseudomonadales bacterium]|nr:hypothetical protein [Pseudomonadales bacterium]MCP5186064.1 hypothetical protein [Pseudomonadales bacterium]
MKILTSDACRQVSGGSVAAWCKRPILARGTAAEEAPVLQPGVRGSIGLGSALPGGFAAPVPQPIRWRVT